MYFEWMFFESEQLYRYNNLSCDFHTLSVVALHIFIMPYQMLALIWRTEEPVDVDHVMQW